MAVSRRQALKAVAAVPIFLEAKPFHLKVEATTDPSSELSRGFRLQAEDQPLLQAIAEVVLPKEADRKAAVAAFQAWIAGYKEGADTDHGYGNTRVRPTGPSPSRNYAAQLAAIDSAARAQGAGSFATASIEQKRAILEAAITEAKVERLSARPTGAHIVTDLMGHYFNSPQANDLCYRAAINRDACRGLPGSDRAPAPLKAPGPSKKERPSILERRSSNLDPRSSNHDAELDRRRP